jgi:4-amino-4-deoxy-L-arabinose transferase-like glycosyltransferase
VIPLKWGVILLAGALVGRIGAAIAIGGGFHFADEAIYVDTARRLSGGGGFGLGYSGVPGYPLFLALLSFGLPVAVVWLRLAQAAVAALGALLVFVLADRMFGRRTAILAGLVYALDPLLVITSGLLYPETAAALLLPPIVLMALDGSERDAPQRSALAGALLALLALLRPVALVLPPLVAAWIAGTVMARPIRRMAHVGALALAFILVFAPWIARNYVVHRQFVPVATQGTQTAPVEVAEVARRGLVVSVASWAWNHPDSLASRVARQFVQFWELTPTRLATDNPAMRKELHRTDPRLEVQPLFSRRLRDWVSAGSFSLELFLALVGIILAVRTHWRRSVLPIAIIVAYAAGYALFAAKLRYRIPVLPLVFLFTGAGAVAVYSLLRRAGGSTVSSPAPKL